MAYIGNQPADIGVYAVQAATGNGVLTAFTLDRAATTASISISIDGVDQIPTTAYAVTVGTTLTFTSAPPNLSVISIRFLGDTVSFGEPSDDSVATAKIQDDAVTAAKLANSINTEITANTAKVTNATHTGDVTGATALTIATDAVDIAMLSATGTASSSTFLRGDNSWTAAGGTNTPAFLASPTNSTTAHAGNTWVKFALEDESFDTDNCYDSVTNFRFTPTTAGKYFVFASMSCNGIGDGIRQGSAFYKNGTQDSRSYSSLVAGGNNENSSTNSYIFDMNGSSDYIEFFGRRDEATARYYVRNGTFFGAYRILT